MLLSIREIIFEYKHFGNFYQESACNKMHNHLTSFLSITFVILFPLANSCKIELNCPNFWQGTSLYNKTIDPAYFSCLNREKCSNPISSKHFFLEPRLHTCFRENPYDTSQLPLAEDQEIEPFVLIYHFSFNNLIELDSTGKFTFLANIALSWNDRNRCWNKDKYPVNFLFVESSEIWTPKFLLINARSNDILIDPKNSTPALIDGGDVTIKMHKKFEATCILELSEFPFDLQECRLFFTLLQYTAEEVTIISSTLVYESFLLKEGEWQLLKIIDMPKNFTTRIFNKTHDGMIILEKYEESPNMQNTGFEVVITFKRHFEYYVNYIIAPVCLMAILGYLAIILRVDCAERLSLSMSVMLGFLFLQSTISSLVPRSGSSPFIEKFVIGCMIMQSSNIVFTTCMVWLSRFANPAPLFIRLFFSMLLHPIKTFECIGKRNRRKQAKNKHTFEIQSTPVALSASDGSQANNKFEQGKEQDNLNNWQDLITFANRCFAILFLCCYILLVKSHLLPLMNSFTEHNWK